MKYLMRIIVTLAVILFGMVTLAVSSFAYGMIRSFLAEHIAGPSSPSGIKVELVVTDAIWSNPGSDYYTDVALTRYGSDYQRFYWSDQSGQQSREAVDALLASMRWTDPETLEFATAEGKTVQISLSGNLWSLHERPTNKP